MNRQTPAGYAAGSAAVSARELQYGCGDCKPGYIENIKGGCILSKIIYTCLPVIYCKPTGRKYSLEFKIGPLLNLSFTHYKSVNESSVEEI